MRREPWVHEDIEQEFEDWELEDRKYQREDEMLELI